jgi:uncharacterized protein YukE
VKVKITNEEIRKVLDAEIPVFPKYVSPLINLANYYAKGTAPRVVGQMSELINEFQGSTLDAWQNWYLSKHPGKIDTAVEKILQMLECFKKQLNEIDKPMVELWVKDLVLVKTFIGLRLQEPILRKAAELLDTSFRFADPSAEAIGVDGYVGEIPVSIKPITYREKSSLPEKIVDIKIIYYTKQDDGIEVDFGDLI